MWVRQTRKRKGKLFNRAAILGVEPRPSMLCSAQLITAAGAWGQRSAAVWFRNQPCFTCAVFLICFIPCVPPRRTGFRPSSPDTKMGARTSNPYTERCVPRRWSCVSSFKALSRTCPEKSLPKLKKGPNLTLFFIPSKGLAVYLLLHHLSHRHEA